MESDPPAPPAGESADRDVRIMVLGFPASGKSTFLAAVWHYFGYGDCDGIMFSTDENTARYLNGYCRELMQGSLPAKTPVTREWSFTIQARGRSGALADTVTLTYADYADYAGHKAGDLVVGLLDGAKIAAIMRDDPDQEYAVWLDRLFLVMAGQGDKPVQLLLTKFDLLHGRYTLGQIVGKLRRCHRPFDRYCQFTGMGKRRLIAVAALGTNLDLSHL
ncbi:MAG TPA: hypothetical protein VHZ33_12500 [Trebonia sp.]|jgi:hypothetical protein|nr:hypothetical protein [Trebonia sp.]